MIIEELNIRVKVQPGDVLFFRSAAFHHWVQDFEKERCSIVLYTHNTLMARGNNMDNRPVKEIPKELLVHCKSLDEEALQNLKKDVQKMHADANTKSRKEKKAKEKGKGKRKEEENGEKKAKK